MHISTPVLQNLVAGQYSPVFYVFMCKLRISGIYLIITCVNQRLNHMVEHIWDHSAKGSWYII